MVQKHHLNRLVGAPCRSGTAEAIGSSVLCATFPQAGEVTAPTRTARLLVFSNPPLLRAKEGCTYVAYMFFVLVEGRAVSRVLRGVLLTLARIFSFVADLKETKRPLSPYSLSIEFYNGAFSKVLVIEAA